jgi:hypothetical protein
MANTGAGLGISIAEAGLGSVLNRYALRVPLNQRSYAWKEAHVKTLLQDLTKAIEEDAKAYFMGTIVLTQGNDRLEVADGQQRLATTAILISAIRDHLYGAGKHEREAANKYTQTYLLEFDEHSGEHLPKLILNSEDNDFFVKNALLAPDDALRNLGAASAESHARLDQAFRLCREHIAQIVAPLAKPEQGKRLYRWVSYLKDSAIIIEIKVPDQFNAYTLFETLNDRGLRASQADILKNYLFGKAQDRLHEVAPKWASMAMMIESVDADDLLLTYLRHYWISYNGPTLAKELAERIREKVVGRQQAVDTAISLAKDAIDYAALFSPLEHPGWQDYPKETRAYLYIITRVLQVEQIRPLLLAVIRHFSHTEARKAFRAFVAWSVRFLVAGGGGGGVLDRSYGFLAKHIAEAKLKTAKQLHEEMKSVVRTDADFRGAFGHHRVTKTVLARYYLRAIELHRQGKARPELGGIMEDTEVFNLEHVLPLTPSKGWKIDDDVIQAYAKRLGNMTLLDPSDNAEVGNQTFGEKVARYKKSPLAITKELANYKKWGPDEIDGTQNKMADDSLYVWPL